MQKFLGDKMNVEEYIKNRLRKEKLHFTLIDPDSETAKDTKKLSLLKEINTDAILIGGSTQVRGEELDDIIKSIKKITTAPIIIFPGGVGGISRYADAIFFMSLLNSRNPYFITKAQALGAFQVKSSGLETLPMGYLIVSPGETAGFIGEADLLPRNKPKIAAAYALAAQYMGMRFVYLEAGSGASEPVPLEMIKYVKKAVDIPVIVGGGIKEKEKAEEISRIADILVTGTIAEENFDKLKEIVNAVKGIR
ncbi:MAG TPA: geranylgeranylglyceryl/heptaprenylglyceryl phosphate synthase [Methanomicrobia archaeon]|nr:geranylgeranylglyceryl/heptaprenylglyceryl phosphate synthase [Methanomicrobia archaeon]